MTAVSAEPVSIDRLHTFCTQALLQIGVSERDASITVDALVTTDGRINEPKRLAPRCRHCAYSAGSVRAWG